MAANAVLRSFSFAITFWMAGLIFFEPSNIFAQAPVTVSKNIENFEGKSYYLHVVEPQQTLFGIARAYGITVESLMMANPDARTGIRVKQVLRVPAGGNLQSSAMKTASPAVNDNVSDEFEYIYHVAGKGENFTYLAGIYMVPERRIRDANPSRAEPFGEGDYLLIPVSKKDKRPPVTQSSQLQRSNYDPYNVPRPDPSKTTPTPSRREAVESEPVRTISPFDNPLQNAQNQPRRETQAPQPTATRPGEPVQPPSETLNQGSVSHVVKPQETLYSLARQYNTTPAALLEANPGINEQIKVGQVIRLPNAATQATTTAQTVNTRGQLPSTGSEADTSHIVQKGETLFRISRQYAVSIDELKLLNPGLTETISVGQRILIPKKKISQSYLIHQSNSQQRTRDLARDYGLSVNELQEVNPSLGRTVYPNQSIKIPLDQSVTRTQPLAPGQAVQTEPKPVKAASDYYATGNYSPQTDISHSDCIAKPGSNDRLFRIALMIPLYLDEVDGLKELVNNTRIPQERPRPLTFLPYYNGFLMAADSLAKQFGLRAELRVYDVDQSAIKLQQALSDPQLKNADLIIGPFFSQAFDQVSAFALEHKIMIVNPMSLRRQIVENNPYVVKMKPDPSDQFDQVAAMIAANYPNAKVFIYHSNSFRGIEEAQTLANALNAKLPSAISLRNSEILRFMSNKKAITTSVNSDGHWIDAETLRRNPEAAINLNNAVSVLAFDSDKLNHLRSNSSHIRDNVVVFYTDDRALAMDFMNRINQLADEFSFRVVGMPNWSRFDNLFSEHLMRSNVHYVEPSFINYDELRTEFFVHRYRSVYNTEPDQYAFEGFDAAWFFLQYLMQFGNDMQCLENYRQRLLQSGYVFRKLNAESGYENVYWNVYNVSDYRLMPVKDLLNQR